MSQMKKFNSRMVNHNLCIKEEKHGAFLNEMRTIQCGNTNNSLDTAEIVKARDTASMF